MSKQVLVLQREHIQQLNIATILGIEPVLAQNNLLRFAVADDFQLSSELKQLFAQQQTDWAIVPDKQFADLGLIVSDMDSTLISIECIDEIADRLGIKDQVAQITERAMRGELDFSQSLIARVALLEGLPVEELQYVYEHIVQLSAGAEYLIAECQRYQVKFLLVSGGFTFFTDRLKQRLGLDYAYANILECADNKLTGKVLGNIIDAQAKADLLLHYQQQLNLHNNQVLAMGDGANDILMLQAAGIGVAYHAKAKTKQSATFCIDYHGLEFVRNCFS